MRHQKADTTGHRPTWSIGVNAWTRDGKRRNGKRPGSAGSFVHRFSTYDPFGFFNDRIPGAAATDGKPARTILRAERKCLRQLDLEDTATKADIKARFKELVKRLHPDHNLGDRSSEDKLREVIQAYNYLRQAGLA
jgi:hypothetical protein